LPHWEQVQGLTDEPFQDKFQEKADRLSPFGIDTLALLSQDAVIARKSALVSDIWLQAISDLRIVVSWLWP
jgi:hypothetical protein